MRRRFFRSITVVPGLAVLSWAVLSLVLLSVGAALFSLEAKAAESYEWRQELDAKGELKSYWYENGVRQGTYEDSQGVIGDGTVRGREIFDPASDGWYWLDAVYEGAKACSKEVWMPYIYQKEADFSDEEIKGNAAASGDMAAQVEKAIRERTGKWVRYDADGKMYKGWYTVEEAEKNFYPEQLGNTYYYDPKTGLMAKGKCVIEEATYMFDEETGVLQGQVFTFSTLPTNAEEMMKLPEATLDTPYKTVALAMLALLQYENSPDTCYAMLDALRGPDPMTPYAKSFIKDRLQGKEYKVKSFFRGATVDNDYTPTTPYEILVSDNPYSFVEENWATIYVHSAGADSPRPLKLRKKPSTGQWFLNDIQCLSDIREPSGSDPWK